MEDEDELLLLGSFGPILQNCLFGCDISEVYSPPKVILMAKKMGLSTGIAMDLDTGFDFTKRADRERAWTHLETTKPLVVFSSPPCTPFSRLQAWH